MYLKVTENGKYFNILVKKNPFSAPFSAGGGVVFRLKNFKSCQQTNPSTIRSPRILEKKLFLQRFQVLNQIFFSSSVCVHVYALVRADEPIANYYEATFKEKQLSFL